ncbi:MAG: hypothetical protein ACRETI_05835 [Steroidobacteraceae bacterium]
MTDQDIDRWTAAWQSGAPPTADLARMAQRERRILTAWIALDWTVGAGLIAFAAWLWFAVGTPVTRFAAAGIAVLTVVVLAFTVVNWRGSFAGDRASAADFLGLALARSRARLRYIRFGWWVLAADLVVIAGAVGLEIRDEGAARLPGILAMVALATAVAAGILLWWGQRECRRAQKLGAMQRAMQPDQGSGHD